MFRSFPPSRWVDQENAERGTGTILFAPSAETEPPTCYAVPCHANSAQRRHRAGYFCFLITSEPWMQREFKFGGGLGENGAP